MLAAPGDELSVLRCADLDVLGAVAAHVSFVDESVVAQLSMDCDDTGLDDAWLLARVDRPVRRHRSSDSMGTFGNVRVELSLLGVAPIVISGVNPFAMIVSCGHAAHFS